MEVCENQRQAEPPHRTHAIDLRLKFLTLAKVARHRRRRASRTEEHVFEAIFGELLQFGQLDFRIGLVAGERT